MLSLVPKECSSLHVISVFLFCSNVASPVTNTLPGKQPVANVMANKPWDKHCAILNLSWYLYRCQVVNRLPRPQVEQNCQNSPELFASHTIDDEVDGAVDDSQVPRDHVHHQLPLRTKI